MSGPFETELEAMAAAADAMTRLSAEDNRELVAGTLAAAAVELRAYDRRIVEWPAIWEPSTVAVVCRARPHQPLSSQPLAFPSVCRALTRKQP